VFPVRYELDSHVLFRSSGAQGGIFNNMLYMRYKHLKKARVIHNRQTHPLIRENFT
jgi:hypothetical protein